MTLSQHLIKLAIATHQEAAAMTEILDPPRHPLVEEAKYNLMRSISYLSDSAKAEVADACDFGAIAHIKDKRKSGEPYITHPIAVAEILAGFRLDRDTIIAAILHDTVEDTEVTHQQIADKYGEVVANLVDGVTKLKSSKNNKLQNKAATFHKILNATLDDARVLVIKLADRLHNMSTLDAVRPEKQEATARETLDFYVPFARVLGLNDIADHIEMLCYRNLNPKMYTKLSDKILQHGLGRNFKKETIHQYLTYKLEQLELNGHVKALDNRVVMYRKFFRNRGEINDLVRLYDFDIILDNIDACDKLAYYLIQRYQIHDSQIEDNIRRPRPGGNQSLTLTYEMDNDTIKVTIMTKQMQQAARLGAVGLDMASDVSKSVIQASLRNLKELVEDSQQQTGIDIYGNGLDEGDNTISVVDALLSYLHSSKILCYSPQGRAYELPRGATALDFAYAVGPFVGNIATGANIDNQPAKLGTVLQDGQTVEIEVDKDAAPKAEWLGFIVTNKARAQILRWFKDLSPNERQQHGAQALDRALRTYDKALKDLRADDWQNLFEWRGINSKEQLFEQISQGKLLPQLVVSRIFSDIIENKQAQNAAHGNRQTQHAIANAAGVEVVFAICCHPIYGDEVVGHQSRHGLVVHRHRCYSVDDIRKDNPYQIIQIRWLNVTAPEKVKAPALQEVVLNSPKNEVLLAASTDNLTTDTVATPSPATTQVAHSSTKAYPESSDDTYYLAYLELSITLSDEQITDVISHLREMNVGVEAINVIHHEMITVMHLLVLSRIHLKQVIEMLRRVLDYPNIQRLYRLTNRHKIKS